MDISERKQNRMLSYTATLPDEDATQIKAIGKGNLSAGIRKLLAKHNEQANSYAPNQGADNADVSGSESR